MLAAVIRKAPQVIAIKVILTLIFCRLVPGVFSNWRATVLSFGLAFSSCCSPRLFAQNLMAPSLAYICSWSNFWVVVIPDAVRRGFCTASSACTDSWSTLPVVHGQHCRNRWFEQLIWTSCFHTHNSVWWFEDSESPIVMFRPYKDWTPKFNIGTHFISSYFFKYCCFCDGWNHENSPRLN